MPLPNRLKYAENLDHFADTGEFTGNIPLAAKRQLAQRALARRRLIHYILRFRPTYKAGWVHKLICAKIEKFMLDVENNRSPRLMFFMPPRTGKSTIVSEDAISWMLGHHPEWEFIAASYAVSLPLVFSRRVKDRLAMAEYQALFPEAKLNPKAQATEGWYTTLGGGYLPAGVDGGLTGRGANVLSDDDPVKDDKEAESELIRERAWNWWNAVADTRLAPGAGVLHTQCMTGDTPVRMADGSHLSLADVRPGMLVATYAEGVLSTARVLKHRSNHDDSVLRMTMTSGKMVRANKRHPFLVLTTGGLKWVRLKNLRLGQKIVVVRDNGENGKVRPAKPRIAANLLPAVGFAHATTVRPNGPAVTALHQQKQIPFLGSILNSNIVTVLRLKDICRFLRIKDECVRFVRSLLKSQATLFIGIASYVSTIAMTPIRSVGFFATTATLWSSEALPSKCSKTPLVTYDFTLEAIESIEPAGVEEVFDVQIEGTENFIANGLVSHNTRWHDEDLGGKLLTQERELSKEVDEMIDIAVEQLDDRKLDGDHRQVLEAKIKALEVEREREITHWDVISFPALAKSDEWLTSDDKLVETNDRPANAVRKLRSKDEALHPDRYDEFYYRRKRRTTIARVWSALYQQDPTPDEGDYWQRGYFRYERQPTAADMVGWYVFQAWDLAIGQKARNDWTVGLTGALDFDANLHLINYTRVRTDALASLILDSAIPYQYKLRRVGLEQGQIQMSVMPEIRRLIDEYRKAGKLIHAPVFDDRLKPITDKEARGVPAQGLGQQGRIWVPDNQPWVEEFIGRLLRFPHGAWDDDHDAVAWLVRLVAFFSPPRRLSVKPKPMSERPWRERVKAHIEDQEGRGGGYLGA